MEQQEQAVVSQESPDTSQQEGGTTDAPDVSQETQQELWAGKYKTPEDLASGYKELESKFGQTSAEAKQAREQLEQYQQQLAYLQQQQQQAAQQNQYDVTQEEKLQQDISNLQVKVFTGELEKVQNDFLAKNEELNNDIGIEILNSVASKIRAEKPWVDPWQTGNSANFKQILEDSAKRAKELMGAYTEKVSTSAKKDVVETREELKTGAAKSGRPVDTTVEREPAGESLEEYSARRRQQHADTQRY